MADLDDLVAAVSASAKYRGIDRALVRRIGQEELAKRRTLKTAIKATKDRLHQVGGAFLAQVMLYDRWLGELRAAADAGDLRPMCRAIMAHHTSMRERLPFLDDFYAAIFADLPPITSVLDLACGLHPLALPWMPLAPGARYHACDIYAEMIAFIGAFLPLTGVRGKATTCDVTQAIPPEPADLAFLLKAIPCLEQIDRDAGRRLLAATPARWLVVSFPSQSLGGRHKGMPAFYEAHLHELVAGKDWAIRRLAFPTELVFVIDTRRQL
jgi:16S rRNA (guanine(1405)-N(7))-methyltransferase